MLKSIAKAAAKARRARIREGKSPSVNPLAVIDPTTGEHVRSTIFTARDNATDRFDYDAAADENQYTPFDHRLI